MEHFVAKDIGKTLGSFRLEGISITADTHDVVGLIGKNGAGKTSFLRSITGLYPLHQGTVHIKGQLLEWKKSKVRRNIAFLPESVGFPHRVDANTLARILAGFYPNWKTDRFRQLLTHFEVNPSVPVRSLSTGTLKKLGVATALSSGASLIILDEPTSNVDPVSRDQILKALQIVAREDDTVLVFSSHILYDIWSVASRIVVIHDGCKVHDERLVPELGNQEFEQIILSLLQ